jgi:hypothetical protein
MSVRGAYGFVYKGEMKITYNHADSIPNALGSRVVEFCRHMTKEALWDDLKSRLPKVALVDENAQVPENVLSQRKYTTLAKNMKKEGVSPSWYNLLRPYSGGEMLWKISKGEVEYMTDASQFPQESLFCEYVYIIDLDSMTLDVFIGHQKKPTAGGPFGEAPHTYASANYYPCRMVASFYLDKLPAGDKWIEPIAEAEKQDKAV